MIISNKTSTTNKTPLIKVVEEDKYENSTKETGRVEAFSDGVFAIAITLLVLDIHVPDIKENESLLQHLLADWTTHLAFLIGFFTILVCWINHHYMFEHIRKCNGMLLLLNGFKLLVVSFTPFATAVISKYMGTTHQQIATNLYALNFFLMGLAMTGIWCYAYQNKLLKSASPEFLKAVNQLYILAPVISGTIFILSFINIWISLVLFGVMFMIYVIPKKSAMRLEKLRGSNF
jgi:uncharacterized membrane protein